MARFYNPVGSGGGDVSFTGEGCIVFPNDGEICNVPNSSGDGYGYSTIQITPDTTTSDDRYIIIDPTAPNHIHIRAGGEQDQSNALLVLGGEKNAVVVDDTSRIVGISTRPAQVVNTYTNINNVSSSNFITTMPADIRVGATVVIEGSGTYTVASVTTDDPLPDQVTATITGGVFTPFTNYTFVYEEEYNNNQWIFAPDGTLYGPVMGLVKVQGIYGQNESPLTILGPESVLIDGDVGEFLNDASVPSNQIATIGDIANTVSSVTSYNPVWSGTGLTYTGTPAVGSYVRIGDVVTVQIDVTLANVTDFGTGQYSLTLPFNSRYHTDVYGGSVHKIVGPTTNHHSLKGHLSPAGNVVSIWDLGAAAQDEQFDHNSPVILTTADRFHMSFTYICE